MTGLQSRLWIAEAPGRQGDGTYAEVCRLCAIDPDLAEEDCGLVVLGRPDGMAACYVCDLLASERTYLRLARIEHELDRLTTAHQIDPDQGSARMDLVREAASEVIRVGRRSDLPRLLLRFGIALNEARGALTGGPLSSESVARLIVEAANEARVGRRAAA